jgi:hypothetical protein
MSDWDPFQRCFSFSSQNVFSFPDDVLAICTTQSQMITVRRGTNTGTWSKVAFAAPVASGVKSTDPSLLVEVTDSSDQTRIVNTFRLPLQDVTQLLYCKFGSFFSFNC